MIRIRTASKSLDPFVRIILYYGIRLGNPGLLTNLAINSVDPLGFCIQGYNRGGFGGLCSGAGAEKGGISVAV
jgi:hypothetical protein